MSESVKKDHLYLVDGKWLTGLEKNWWPPWALRKSPVAKIEFNDANSEAPWEWRTAYSQGVAAVLETAVAEATDALERDLARYPKAPTQPESFVQRLRNFWSRRSLVHHYNFKKRSEEETYSSGRSIYGVYWGSDPSAILGIGYDLQELVEFAVHRFGNSNNLRQLKVGLHKKFKVTDFLGRDDILIMLRKRRLTMGEIVGTVTERHQKVFPHGKVIAPQPDSVWFRDAKSNFRRIISSAKREGSHAFQKERHEADYGGFLDIAKALVQWAIENMVLTPSEGYADGRHPLPVVLSLGKWRYGFVSPDSGVIPLVSVDYATSLSPSPLSGRVGVWHWQTIRGEKGESDSLWKAMVKSAKVVKYEPDPPQVKYLDRQHF